MQRQLRSIGKDVMLPGASGGAVAGMKTELGLITTTTRSRTCHSSRYAFADRYCSLSWESSMDSMDARAPSDHDVTSPDAPSARADDGSAAARARPHVGSRFLQRVRDKFGSKPSPGAPRRTYPVASPGLPHPNEQSSSFSFLGPSSKCDMRTRALLPSSPSGTI